MKHLFLVSVPFSLTLSLFLGGPSPPSHLGRRRKGRYAWHGFYRLVNLFVHEIFNNQFSFVFKILKLVLLRRVRPSRFNTGPGWNLLKISLLVRPNKVLEGNRCPLEWETSPGPEGWDGGSERGQGRKSRKVKTMFQREDKRIIIPDEEYVGSSIYLRSHISLQVLRSETSIWLF